MIVARIDADIVGVVAQIDTPDLVPIHCTVETDRTVAAGHDDLRLRTEIRHALRLVQALNSSDDVAAREIDVIDGAIAIFGDEEMLVLKIERQMINATLHVRQRDSARQPERRSWVGRRDRCRRRSARGRRQHDHGKKQTNHPAPPLNESRPVLRTDHLPWRALSRLRIHDIDGLA